MARSSECTGQYAQKVLDTADIVRDACSRQLTCPFLPAANALKEAIKSASIMTIHTKQENGFLVPLDCAITLACFVPVLVFALALPLQSQQDSCEKRVVIVNVHDKHGQFVPSLQASDFLAKVQGKEVNIISVAESTETPRIVIALDASGSMIGLEGALHRVTDEILRTSSDKAQFALLMFSDRILKVVEFGSIKPEIASAVRNIPSAAGRTASRDSLLYATKLFGAPQVGDSVIVVSSGGDNQSKTSIDKLMQAYLSAGIRVSVIRPFKYGQSEDERHAAAEMDDVADSTGGFVDNILSPDDFSLMDQVINQQLLKYYVLETRVPPIQRPTPWQVEIIDSSHRKRKNIKIAIPQKLIQCASSTAFRP